MTFKAVVLLCHTEIIAGYRKGFHNMKCKKFRITTTTEAEDLVSGMLMELGIEGVEIEDNVQLTDKDTKAMFIDILPELPPDEGVGYVSFYLDEADVTDELIDRYGSIPAEVDNLLKIIKIKILSREKYILKVSQRRENVVFYFEADKFNIDIIDKLMKKFRNRIKFSPAKEPYITFKLLNERNVLEEAIEFLENL